MCGKNPANKAHQARQAVDEGGIPLADFQGNQEADEVANLGAAAHAENEPTAEYLRWKSWLRLSEIVLKPGRGCDFLLGLKLRLRCPPMAGPGEPLPQAPHVEGPHRRVLTFNTFA
eukprot:4872780-Amphidinium_carterae.1